MMSSAASVTGLDRGPSAPAFARQRPDPAIACVAGDARARPFADASVDAVVSVTALCFVDAWLPSGNGVARAPEKRLPSALPLGSFPAVGAEVIR